MPLRPYQSEILAAVRRSYKQGVRQQLVLAATGTGKTYMFSQIPGVMHDLLPGQTLVLAHRDELVTQAVNTMRLANSNLSVGREMSTSYANVNDDVIVGSVPTLQGERARRLNWDRITTVVTDEAHHGINDSYKYIYSLANVLPAPEGRLHVGVTATGQRADGKAMVEVFKKVIYEYPIRQAIADGYLVDLRGLRVKTNTSLAGIKIGEGGGQQDDLADRINNPERNQIIVKAWLEHAVGLSTVAFTANIKHAEDLAAMFRHYGVPAEAVWGDDPRRKEKLEAFHEGEIAVLCNCAVLTEGWDEPRVSCVILARPTRSGVFFAQAVGRSTRLYPGKTHSIVLDIVDASAGLSLLTLPTLMGLSTNLDLQGRGLYESIQKLEEAAKEYPQIDFSKLADINSLDTFIESTNLFDIKFPEEVEINSDLTWYTNPTGGYILKLPKPEDQILRERYIKKEKRPPADEVTVVQNILDKFEIRAKIKGKSYKGERNTIGEAFLAADSLIHDQAPEALKLIERDAFWHDGPASEKQLKKLRQLYKGRAIPLDIDKGMASRLISQALAK